MQRGIPSIRFAGTIVTFVIASLAIAAQPREARLDATRAKPADRPRAVGHGETVHSDGVAIGTLYPIPRDAKVDRYVAGIGVVGEAAVGRVGGDVDTCRYDPTSVYCNTLSNSFWQSPIPDPAARHADDIAITAVAGCELDRYAFMVMGNADGQGVDGYSVDAVLYPSCPGVVGAAPVAGTECYASFEDNGIKLVTCPIAPGVILPQNLFMLIKFSRLHCAIAVGAPALKGFSGDVFDYPGFACRADLGGYLPQTEWDTYGIHASFYAEVYTRGVCPAAFPNYKSSMHAGLYYTAGGGRRFADDISLAVPQCYLTAYEVAVKGHGVTTVDLRIALNNADPVWGGVIPGTRKIIFSDDDLAVTIGHWDFDPPIHLSTPDLWVGYKTSSAVTGPVITDRPADLGRNEDSIAVHDGSVWVVGPLGNDRYGTTDVTIFCEGSPPVGACCDMIFPTNHICIGGPNDGKPCSSYFDCNVCVGGPHDTDSCRGHYHCRVCVGGPDDGDFCWSDSYCEDGSCVGGDCPWIGTCIGESVCREDLPEMNCPFTRWIEEETCSPDPFLPACGLSACCTLESGCLDLTEQECFAQPPVDELRVRRYQLGEFCEVGDQSCPWVACFSQEGDCAIARPSVGCESCPICATVCDADPWCCTEQWDAFCVITAQDLCSAVPQNRSCLRALHIDTDSSTTIGTAHVREQVNDPALCCHSEVAGAQGFNLVWFTFEATHTSARMHTCDSLPRAGDSVLEVFRVLDPSTPETACGSLDLIACNDNATDCAGGFGSDVCVTDLIAGETYYVLLAAKDEDGLGVYQLDIESPCNPVEESIHNDYCYYAELFEGGATEPIAIPFDLSGGDTYLPATFDCLSGPDVLRNMQNDIWYDWVAPCGGEAMIETCDQDLPGATGQPNTTMIVYDGCDCPVEDARTIAYSDDCGLECGLSSCVTIDVAGRQCYKIRLGGYLGGTPEGNLTIAVDCATCPAGYVTFLDPAGGTVDARRPHPPHDSGLLQGIDTILVEAPGGAGMTQCWTLCETVSTGTDNFISEVVDNGDMTLALLLNRPMTPGAVTTITYNGGHGMAYTGAFTSHPSNVNGDGQADSADVQMLIDVLTRTDDPIWGHYSTDCDHSGSTTVADVLCIIDLLNGGDAYAPGYSGTNLPTNAGICP